MAAKETDKVPIKVFVVTARSPNIVSCTSSSTAEEICIILCLKYKIPPLTRSLFALRIKGTEYFLKDNAGVSPSKEYELRIRFQVPRIKSLLTLDETTFDYYFQQARNDVNDNNVPEIKYPDHKKELLGLGITDMCRATIEENLKHRDVIKNYKKYIPKVIVKRHGHFPKKHADSSLPKLCSNGHEVNNVKNWYLELLYTLAPNYLSEEYHNVLWMNGAEVIPCKVIVAPFHKDQPGIRLYNLQKRDWFHACTIEELIYLTRSGDNSLEVSRRGTPLFFKFESEEQLSSFISCCDGYYRLIVKWTFNLSKSDETPSLVKLHSMKCHGPVGGAFSYRKLEEKRNKKHGTYILRQCQDDYNVYYLDVCNKNNTAVTYRVDFKGNCYVFNDEKYGSIELIIASHQKPDGKIYLKECIPPSEYDKSQLLLCGEPERKGVRVDQAQLQEILRDNRSPRCLPTKDILLYTGTEKVSSSNVAVTYRALWKLDETKKLLVAFKSLQKDKMDEYLKDFMDLAGKWACVHSGAIVRLYGVTLSSPTAMVLEYLPYGPFDEYLKANASQINARTLLRVAAGLARALWDLSEAGVVHAHVRCRRLLVSAREPLAVKLAGPSLRAPAPADIHWIPVELNLDSNLVRRSSAADIYAFATTLWEMFSYGQSPADLNPTLTAKAYANGDRLSQPADCPRDLYRLMMQCWSSDPPRPQEIMRDINYMVHPDCVLVHQYDVPKLPHDIDGDTISSNQFISSEQSDAGSNKSLISVDSSIPSTNGTNDFYDGSDNNSSTSLERLNALTYELRNACGSGRSVGTCAHDAPDDWAAPRLMESIVSQGRTYLVTVHKKIGSGNYGHVYQGWMESDNQESHRHVVAIKKLTREASERNGSLYEDFKNELEIMKSLQHTNIVEILGYSWERGPDVLIVMEYLKEGSLNHYLRHQGDKLRIEHLLKYARDIATGMDHVSAKNVVHRDLATRNILVVNKHHVKISDFGLARIIPKEENAYRLKTDRLLPINWYAPESAVEPWHFSTKSDVWSYGVTVWEIFTKAMVEVPKFDDKRPKERASCFQIPDGCPSEIFRYLMKDCWNLDPNLRPKFIELVHLCKGFIEEYK